MYKLLPLILLCAACASSERPPTWTDLTALYKTQTAVPTPDYRAVLDQAVARPVQTLTRQAISAPPRDAKAIGAEWLARLEQRDALLGYGLADGGADAPVATIDAGLTIREFDQWIQENGWTAPQHIRWEFVAEMGYPTATDAARRIIRYWPASTARTGAQLQALHSGRIELRDGCFFVGEPGRPATKLAWFHAEMGLDIDTDGYVILRDRIDGSIRARVGETMSWAGPASAKIEESAREALLHACGPGEILVVGSPESSERFNLRIADLRNRSSSR